MKDLKNYIETNKDRFLQELFGLIRIPSISSGGNIETMTACAEYLKKSLIRNSKPFWFTVTMMLCRQIRLICGKLLHSSLKLETEKSMLAVQTTIKVSCLCTLKLLSI